jgi:hypothetical protein
VKGRLVILLALTVLVLGIGGGLASARVRTAVFGVPGSAKAPRGIRVRVQVLNASTIRGLGRRATELLRDRGFDVVEVGTTSARERGDSTFVLDRSGHSDWAKRVATAMGGATVVSRPDSSRYLDVTVLVGATWHPPPEPFNP